MTVDELREIVRSKSRSTIELKVAIGAFVASVLIPLASRSTIELKVIFTVLSLTSISVFILSIYYRIESNHDQRF